MKTTKIPPRAKKKKPRPKPKPKVRTSKPECKVAGKGGEGRTSNGRLLPGFKPRNDRGRPGGVMSISAAIRRQLKKNRGDRPTIDRILDRYFDLLVKGTQKDIARMLRDGIQLFSDRLEGRPAQTIVADVTRRDDPISRLSRGERQTVLRRFIEEVGVEGLDP